MKLLRELEREGSVDISDLKPLVKTFLVFEELEMSQELYDALKSLKANSKTLKVEMLLREIEKVFKVLGYVFYRLEDTVNVPETVQQLEREDLIDKELKEKLLEKPYKFSRKNEVMKKPIEKGSGLTQYLPGSLPEMMEKLELLMGEFSAGNTTVLTQIIAALTWLHNKDYKKFCEQLGTCPQY